MSAKVFISYSSVDEKTAKQVAKTLAGLQIEYFLDRKDITWGDDITDKITAGLSDCSALVVIISPASLKSQWVPFEIGQATALRKKILPFLAHPSVEVPGYLQRFHYKSTLSDVRDYFELVFAPASQQTKKVQTGDKVTPKERDAIRAQRNELVVARLKQVPSVHDCSGFQLDDHTDNGYLLHITFDSEMTSAAEVIELARNCFNDLFPDIPVWGEMKAEAEDSVGFAYTYIDKYNKRARRKA